LLTEETICCYDSGDAGDQSKEKLNLNIDLNDVKQTMHSFGASDGWTCKFVGVWADVAKKNKIADLLFSQDTLMDGSPEGIGLSLWRFTIGDGSFEQEDASGISTDWRREECFLNSDGSYNWNKEAGQQWFLQAAQQRGVPYTLGFSRSPPVYMTKNGKAFNGTGGIHLNIQDGKMSTYADFLAEVSKHFHLDYISPVNEPQWNWDADSSGKVSDEGSPATNTDIASLVKLLSPQISATSSKIVVGEAAQWDFLYGNNTEGRGDQINRFFSFASPDYIGNMPGVAHVISAHSYFTTCPDDNLVNVRRQVADKIRQVDATLETWQTEFGVLRDICGVYNGWPRNITIDYGLYVAKVIHNDLTIANVSSWQWWLAVSPYNYSDGLVYINDPSGNINFNNCRKDGIILDSKQLWAYGNYSRFIRPGMQRIAASVQGIDDPVVAAGSIMVSAFKDEKNKKLVIVLVNMNSQARALQLNNSISIKNNMLNTYTTDATSNLRRSATAKDNIIINGKSIVTLTGEY
jgi:hypothetical protein